MISDFGRCSHTTDELTSRCANRWAAFECSRQRTVASTESAKSGPEHSSVSRCGQRQQGHSKLSLTTKSSSEEERQSDQDAHRIRQLSIRGLYVQANNVMFNDPRLPINTNKYLSLSLAIWADTPRRRLAVVFSQAWAAECQSSTLTSRHPTPPVSMATVARALQNAKSSVMFAVMELGGSGSVLQTLQKAHSSGKSSYGMTRPDLLALPCTSRDNQAYSCPSPR